MEGYREPILTQTVSLFYRHHTVQQNLFHNVKLQQKFDFMKKSQVSLSSGQRNHDSRLTHSDRLRPTEKAKE